MKPLELYIHIPFCVRKCDYCDFLSFPCGAEGRGIYLQALTREIDCCGIDREDYRISSVFFGGGTPSLLEPGQIALVLSHLRQQFVFSPDAEISMEANPGTLTAGKLEGYRQAGINRLSIGCQSVHDEELERLGRIHRFRDFQESFRLAREAGFANINVDLMSAIPGQTRTSFRQCLETILALRPEHISAYSLIVEEGTPFADHEEDLDLPDEDTERDMVADARRLLSSAGYRQYEISNYAREGYACRHNIGYWTGVPYLAFGLGASSYMEEKRWHNPEKMEEYLKNAGKPELLKRDLQALTLKERMEEFMFLGLRMTEGVSVSEFEARFGVSLPRQYRETIEHFVRERLLTISGDRVCLSERGMDLANVVMAEFLFDE